MKTWVLGTIAAAIIASLFFSGVSAIIRFDREINLLKQDINLANNEVASTNNELAKLTGRTALLEEKLDTAKEKIASTENEIVQLQTKLSLVEDASYDRDVGLMVDIITAKIELQNGIAEIEKRVEKEALEYDVEIESVRAGIRMMAEAFDREIALIKSSKVDREYLDRQIAAAERIAVVLLREIIKARQDAETELSSVNKKLETLENKISPGVYAKAGKSVVSVETPESLGTGFLYGSNRQVITNYHVVDDFKPAIFVAIKTNDGTHQWVAGKVIKSKPEWDLALIELASPLDAEPLLPNKNPIIEQPVWIIGNPAGLNNSLSKGMVSGIDRDFGLEVKFIQTDAAIYWGNSGGPVLDSDGKVIGVLSKGLWQTLSFGFAIPIDYVEKFLAEE